MSAAQASAAMWATGSSIGCGRHQRHVAARLARDVLRHLEVHRSGPFLHRYPECLPNDRGDAGRADDLPGQLGQRLHGADHIDDLEARLLAAPDRLLPGDQDHRYAPRWAYALPRSEG
jgi:hypothetical protein